MTDYVYVTEYAELSMGLGGRLGQVPQQPPIVKTQRVTITTHTELALNAKTRLVRLHATAICSYVFGTSAAAADTADSRMIAGQTEYVGIDPNQTTTLSVVTNT